MNNLPPELVGLIADQCEHSSLKTLRLVSREISDVVTPWVFEHFYMAIFDECHDKLISISRSKLAKYIKRFTVHLDALPFWCHEEWEDAINYNADISDWKAHRLGEHDSTAERTGDAPDEPPFDLPDALANGENQEPRHLFSSEQLDHGWTEFQSLREQQYHWHESREGISLKECFAMLPNLDTVICTSAYTSGKVNFRRTWPVWKRMRRRILVSPNDWASLYAKSGWMVGVYRDFSRRISFAVLEAIAFRASFSGTKHVTQLRLHSPQIRP